MLQVGVKLNGLIRGQNEVGDDIRAAFFCTHWRMLGISFSHPGQVCTHVRPTLTSGRLLLRFPGPLIQTAWPSFIHGVLGGRGAGDMGDAMKKLRHGKDERVDLTLVVVFLTFVLPHFTGPPISRPSRASRPSGHVLSGRAMYDVMSSWAM